LAGGLRRVQRVLPEMFEPMAAEGGRVTMNELLVLFKDAQDTRELGCTARLFVGHRCARPPPRRAVQPRKVLFCSPRDISFVKASRRMGCPLPNCG